MAHHIAFNPDSVRTALNTLRLEMEQGGEGSLTNMNANVKKFVVDGDPEGYGSVDSLRGLTGSLRVSLANRSVDARLLYNDLVDALDALELIIADLKAREDDQSLKSVQMIENMQELVESRITPTTPAVNGQNSSVSTADQVQAGGFSAGGDEQG